MNKIMTEIFNLKTQSKKLEPELGKVIVAKSDAMTSYVDSQQGKLNHVFLVINDFNYLSVTLD